MRFTPTVVAVAVFAVAARGQSSVSIPSVSGIPSGTNVPTSVPTDIANLPNALATCCKDTINIFGGCIDYFLKNPSAYPSGNLLNEEVALLQCECGQPNLVSAVQTCGTCLLQQVPSLASNPAFNTYNSTLYQNACADPRAFIMNNPGFSSVANTSGADLPLSLLSMEAQILTATAPLQNTDFLAGSTAAASAAATGASAGASAGSTPSGSTTHPSSANAASSAKAWVATMIGAVAVFMMAM